MGAPECGSTGVPGAAVAAESVFGRNCGPADGEADWDIGGGGGGGGGAVSGE